MAAKLTAAAPWDAEAIAQLRSLIERRLTHRAIAGIIGRSEAAVMAACGRFSISAPTKDSPPPDPRRKMRKCLSGLGRPHEFWSDHSGHRICPACMVSLETSRFFYAVGA